MFVFPLFRHPNVPFPTVPFPPTGSGKTISSYTPTHNSGSATGQSYCTQHRQQPLLCSSNTRTYPKTNALQRWWRPFGNTYRGLAPSRKQLSQQSPNLPGILLLEPQTQCGEEELQVCVLFLREVVCHVLVDVDHVGATVVTIEGCAEGGAAEEVAEVLVEMSDEETIRINVRGCLAVKDGRDIPTTDLSPVQNSSDSASARLALHHPTSSR
jgi:hypothetical protein